MSLQPTDPQHDPLRAAFRAGEAAGEAAGSWVIDERTTPEMAAAILRGIDEGDPATMDMMPNPLSGEWAGDPTADDVVRDACEESGTTFPPDDFTYGDICDWYEDGYSQAFWDRVSRDAYALIPAGEDESQWTRGMYLACVHGHGGQWSREYRIQCRLSDRMRRHGMPTPEYLSDLGPGEAAVYSRTLALIS